MTDPKPCKTAENHAPTVSKTMGVTVAKLQTETTMTDNNADNDSTETTDNDYTPIVNGVELDSVAGVASAFRHAYDPCNVGHIDIRGREWMVTIQSRGECFDHMDALLEAQKQGHISIRRIAAGTNRDGNQCLTIEVVGEDG